MLRYNCYNSKNMGINVALREGITNYTLRGGSESAPSYLSLFSVVEKAGRLLTHFKCCCFVTSGDLSRFPSSIFIITSTVFLACFLQTYQDIWSLFWTFLFSLSSLFFKSLGQSMIDKVGTMYRGLKPTFWNKPTQLFKPGSIY